MPLLSKLADYNRVSIITDKTGVEGGYVDDPNDSGGETNHGITVGLANQYKAELTSQFNWDGTMRNLSLDMAMWLYTTHFWNKMRLDDVLAVHPLIADKLFDIGINTGKVAAVKMIQVQLNLLNYHGKFWPDMVVDGGLGTITIKALQAFASRRGNEGISRLLIGLLSDQGAYYRDLTLRREKDEDFYFGWLGRVTRDVGHYAVLLGIAT